MTDPELARIRIALDCLDPAVILHYDPFTGAGSWTPTGIDTARGILIGMLPPDEIPARLAQKWPESPNRPVLVRALWGDARG